MNFGYIIDDISKQIKEFNLFYRVDDDGSHEVTIMVPSSDRKMLITEQYIGLVKYGSPEYYQLIDVMVNNIKSFISDE